LSRSDSSKGEGANKAIIALANLKGGVGKSTLAVNIVSVLAPKSVLVDADPQATATAWGGAGHLPLRVVGAPLTGRNLEAWLETVLATDAPFVVIDLPPMLSEATTAALAICDLAVVPVSPFGADLRPCSRPDDQLGGEHRCTKAAAEVSPPDRLPDPALRSCGP
jgi:chromosome partitioning protein